MATFGLRVWIVRAAVGLVVGALVAVAALPPAAASTSTSTSTSPDATELLNGVSCPSARLCVAVGYKSGVNGGGGETTLIERRDGVNWSTMPSPNPGSINDLLESVSCISATNCVAVGYFSAVFGSEATLVERWDGVSWSVVPSPNAAGSLSFLRGVSCPRSNDCVAVGDSVAPSTGYFQTLIETWNGSTWSVTPSPEPGPSSSALVGVACTSATRCTAAGWAFAGSATQGLIEAWNGSQWSVTPSPSPGNNGTLLSVACTGPRSCTAVGYSFDTSGQVTFGETWDGAIWSVTPTVGRDGYLAGVSCANSRRCVAVGVVNNGASDQTLAEVWKRRVWALTASPSPGTNAVLQSVFCSRPRRCLAVGQTFREENASSALAESWNGKQWTISLAAP